MRLFPNETPMVLMRLIYQRLLIPLKQRMFVFVSTGEPAEFDPAFKGPVIKR